MQTRRPTTRAIINAACEVYEVPMEFLTGKSRKIKRVRLRQPIHYLCWLDQTDTLEEIATSTGLTNHATTLHSIKVIEREYGMYDDVTERVDMIREKLISQGYRIKPMLSRKSSKRVVDPLRVDAEWCFRKRVSVLVTDTLTGERREANTVAEAARMAGTWRARITDECRGVRGSNGRYKFEYYE